MSFWSISIKKRFTVSTFAVVRSTQLILFLTFGARTANSKNIILTTLYLKIKLQIYVLLHCTAMYYSPQLPPHRTSPTPQSSHPTPNPSPIYSQHTHYSHYATPFSPLHPRISTSARISVANSARRRSTLLSCDFVRHDWLAPATFHFRFLPLRLLLPF